MSSAEDGAFDALATCKQHGFMTLAVLGALLLATCAVPSAEDEAVCALATCAVASAVDEAVGALATCAVASAMDEAVGALATCAHSAISHG